MHKKNINKLYLHYVEVLEMLLLLALICSTLSYFPFLLKSHIIFLSLFLFFWFSVKHLLPSVKETLGVLSYT